MLKLCKSCLTMKNIKGKKEVCKRCENEMDKQELLKEVQEGEGK
jgi:hypothetical protein